MALFESTIVTPSQPTPNGWGGVVDALGRAAVGKITIRTQVSPDIVIDPFAPAPPAVGPNPLLLLVRPEIEVRSPTGALITTIAPYGSPTSNYLPWLAVGSAALLYGLYRLALLLGGSR